MAAAFALGMLYERRRHAPPVTTYRVVLVWEDSQAQAPEPPGSRQSRQDDPGAVATPAER